MKKSLSLFFAIVLCIGWAGSAYSQQAPTGKGRQTSKVHPRVWQKVQEKGFVNVIVELDMPWQWEEKLSKNEIAVQRTAVADAQKRLLAALAGTKHELGSLFTTSPLMTLEVDPYALAILENSRKLSMK